MPSHVALLRGINVGGRNRVAMADLRELLTSLGHTEVSTYVQSGNVVFTPVRRRDPAALASELERAIADRLGVSPRVVVRTRGELAAVVRDNPYPDEPNPKAVHAVFLTGDPDPELAVAVDGAQQRVAELGSRDTATLVGRTLFLHTPDGIGRSKLAELLVARTSGNAGPGRVAGTARNWSTVTKLLAICDG
ncbi:MAG: DUF1697 domain-containing protein [Micromonosporaceae bacterium]|nr:DUF1697 domain-containing protein [Micromonosporaceae bacterium]